MNERIDEEEWNMVASFWEAYLKPRPNNAEYKFQRRQRPRLYGAPKKEFLPGEAEVHTETKGIRVDWTYRAELFL